MCLITTFRVTPLITPEKTNSPWLFFLKEPAGIVTAKVPIWSVTGCGKGIDRGRGAAQGETGPQCEGIRVWRGAEVDIEDGVEGEEGHPRRRRHNAHANGAVPTGTVATTVLVAVSITETVLATAFAT